MNYPRIHEKWREYWKKNKVNKFDLNDKRPKYYALEMFPYPSGANLHMGHFFNFAPADTHARFKRMTGYNVFHPMGFDAFGLPAENHALSNGGHPWDNTINNMEKFMSQLDELGGMYDWDFTLNTCFPDYYTWTQWLFVELFKSGLAYQKDALVNWCDACKTVLANEQVDDGRCERCTSQVIRRNMRQWFFKITEYAEELLARLPSLDWPNKTKVMQENWIGKSIGATVKFKIPGKKEIIEVFTTRIDTLYGATFVVLAPEHPYTDALTTSEKKKEVDDYIKKASSKSDIERTQNYEKTGVFTGGFAINPATGKQVPIWVADYVLFTYGTGAVMGVPGHDERDFEFATKFNLPVERVIQGGELPYVGTGTLVNSGEFNNTPSHNASTAILLKLEKQGLAHEKTTYRLRDWSIGRQRYWGVPIPIVYCENCGVVAEEKLPVVLPKLADFKPKGAPPLENDQMFVACACPRCKKPAKRETETMDTFVCSSWYFLRYPSVGHNDKPFDKKVTDKLLPVDVYVGGAEHAVMHLLYARFVTKFLHNRGYINFDEPFTRMIHQGMILAPDSTKMSKSRGNTISPDTYTKEFGSDILRLHMLFGFNYIDGGPWSDGALKTITRFTQKIEGLISRINTEKEQDNQVLHVRARTIKQVREDFEGFSFNTAVARCMELVNSISASGKVARDSVYDLVLLVAPMIPHLSEEFHEMLGEVGSIFDKPYPTANPKHLEQDKVEIAVQIDSKIKSRIVVPSKATQAEVEKLCAELIAGQVVKKVVYVENRLINFILG